MLRVSLTGENVYVTHHGATAAPLALIGLLNLINSSEVLEQFKRDRGQDLLVPKYGHANITTRSTYDRLGPSDLCGGATRLVLDWRIRSMGGLGSQTRRWSD